MWRTRMNKLLLPAMLLLTLTACGQASSVKASGELPPPMVSSSATGKVEATPDMAVIRGRVSAQAESSAQAMDQASKQFDSVIRYVEQQGLDMKDLHAAQILVQPQWLYARDKPRRITGYMATGSFTLKLRDNAKLSQLYGGLVDAGANQLDAVTFEFSNYDALELQAISLAVEKAKRKAQAGLTPLGQTVGRVQNMNVNTQSNPRPMMRMANMAMEDSAAAAPKVNVGEQTIQATVSVSFYVE